MEKTNKKVTGLGGIFFKCNDPEKMKSWYSKNLGLVTNEYGSVFEFRRTDMPEKKGYTRIVAKVKRVSDSRKYKTIWLTDRFRILVPHENWRKYWSRGDKNLKGKTVEVRGWAFTSKGTAGMKVYHPSMIDVIDS
jgi:hypothetical protein